MPRKKIIIPKFSVRLNRLINDVSKGNQKKFARKIRLSEAFLSHTLNEHNGASLAMILGIAQTFPKVSINWLLTGKGEMYLKKNRRT